MEAISDLPMLGDMDADYSPQYVKLARVLREKITSGDLKRAAPLAASSLAAEYGVSVRVAYAALEMLAANRYAGRPGGVRFYRVTWDGGNPGVDLNTNDTFVVAGCDFTLDSTGIESARVAYVALHGCQSVSVRG